MEPGRALRDLDRRVLPRLATGLLHVGRHRRNRPFVGGAALLAMAGVLVIAAWAVRDRPPAEPGTARIGVADGESVTGYIASTRQELDRLASSAQANRQIYALVSFTTYLAPDRLAAILTGTRAARAYIRAPMATMDTQATPLDVVTVPDDVNRGMDRIGADRQRIAADFRDLAAGASGPQRSQYQAEAAAYGSEATAYRTHCACVFAAVVRATPTALVELRGRDGVRAVDPAPHVSSLDHAVFSPPLPEQSGPAGPPGGTPQTPSPSQPPSPAPVNSTPPSPAPPSPTPAPPSANPSGSPRPSPSAASGRPDGGTGPTRNGAPDR